MKIFLVFAIALIIILAFALAVLSSMPNEYYDKFFKQKNNEEE